MGELRKPTVGEVVAVLGCTQNPDSLVRVLIELVSAGKLPFNENSYLGLVSGLVTNCFGDDALQLCRSLRARIRGDGLRAAGHNWQFLYRGIYAALWNLAIYTSSAEEDKLEALAHEVACYYFPAGSEAAGIAQRILRHIGEKCSRDLQVRLFAKFEADGYPAEVLDALAEGVNKQIGPRAVLSAYLSRAGVVDVEALKNEIRALCTINVDSNHDQRCNLVAKLAEVMGLQETNRWFASEFPHLINQT